MAANRRRSERGAKWTVGPALRQAHSRVALSLAANDTHTSAHAALRTSTGARVRHRRLVTLLCSHASAWSGFFFLFFFFRICFRETEKEARCEKEERQSYFFRDSDKFFSTFQLCNLKNVMVPQLFKKLLTRNFEILNFHLTHLRVKICFFKKKKKKLEFL